MKLDLTAKTFAKVIEADLIGVLHAVLINEVAYDTVSYTHLTLPTICSV